MTGWEDAFDLLLFTLAAGIGGTLGFAFAGEVGAALGGLGLISLVRATLPE